MQIRATLLSLAVLAAAVAGMPTDLKEPIKLDLAAVMNKTVCPIKIETDYDPERIPKRIKVLKCDRDQNQWCAKMHIPKHECCQHRHHNVTLECVEIQDSVQVYYPRLGQAQVYHVAVGCTCVMQDVPAAPDSVPR